jgi:hypothetical protein
MMPNFGFQPGVLDYWILLSDWRNGSFAILLALGILMVGYAFAAHNKTPVAEGPGPATLTVTPRDVQRAAAPAGRSVQIRLPEQLRQPREVDGDSRASSFASTVAGLSGFFTFIRSRART